MRAQSLNPNALRAFLELYTTLVYGRSSLSRGEREMIATTISARNGCDYCVSHHGEALKFYLKNEDQVNSLMGGQQPESLSARAKALTDYALKLQLPDPLVVSRSSSIAHSRSSLLKAML